MATLQLSFLGPPHIVADGAAVEIPVRKALALLAYLAVTERRHGREALSVLLWPDSDAAHARGSLRTTLSALREAIGAERLDVEADAIQLHAQDEAGIWLDVAAFRAEAAQPRVHGHSADLPCPACLAHLTHAAELWRGEFLAGLYLPDAAGFEEWRFFEAEALRREAGDVLERLTAAQAAGGDLAGATDSARRRLALDPFHEPAHRALMRLYAQNDGRNAALRQYRECARILPPSCRSAPMPRPKHYTHRFWRVGRKRRSPTGERSSRSPLRRRRPHSSEKIGRFRCSRRSWAAPSNSTVCTRACDARWRARARFCS